MDEVLSSPKIQLVNRQSAHRRSNNSGFRAHNGFRLLSDLWLSNWYSGEGCHHFLQKRTRVPACEVNVWINPRVKFSWRYSHNTTHSGSDIACYIQMLSLPLAEIYGGSHCPRVGEIFLIILLKIVGVFMIIGWKFHSSPPPTWTFPCLDAIFTAPWTCCWQNSNGKVTLFSHE